MPDGKKHGWTLAYDPHANDNHGAMRATLERGGVLRGKTAHRAFGDLNLALAWCEDQLLARAETRPT